MLGILTSEFGIPKVEVEGRYYVHCQLLNERCRACEGPKKVSSCSESRLAVEGLHPAEIEVFYELYCEKAFRETALEAYYRTGKLPTDSVAGRSTAEEVVKRNEEPLHEFPNDVEYLSPEECEKRRTGTNALYSRNPEGFPKQWVWSRDRVAAQLGEHGDAARRCSSDDDLWQQYLVFHHKGIELSLQEVRRMVAVGLAVKKMKEAKTQDEEDKQFDQFRSLIHGSDT